jgi:hypothetical protein
MFTHVCSRLSSASNNYFPVPDFCDCLVRFMKVILRPYLRLIFGVVVKGFFRSSTTVVKNKESKNIVLVRYFHMHTRRDETRRPFRIDNQIFGLLLRGRLWSKCDFVVSLFPEKRFPNPFRVEKILAFHRNVISIVFYEMNR